MSADGRVGGYTWVPNNRGAGNAYAGQGYYAYKPCILLHMTVSMGISPGYIAGHAYPPHLWANPYTGAKYQTIELDRAALALYQPPFGYHWTNKHDYMLQTEIVGVPEVNVATFTDAQGKWIGENVIAPKAAWLRARGLPIDLNQVRYHANTSGSASEYWPGRMSEQEMADYNGVLAHIDTWANDHWDCSAEHIDQWAAYARAVLGDGGGKEVTYAFHDERIDLVGWNRDDGRVWHKWYDGTRWQPGADNHAGGWEELGPQVKLGKGNEATSPPSCGWYRGQFHVFWSQPDRNLRQMFWQSDGWHTDWVAGPIDGVAVTVKSTIVQT